MNCWIQLRAVLESLYWDATSNRRASALGSIRAGGRDTASISHTLCSKLAPSGDSSADAKSRKTMPPIPYNSRLRSLGLRACHIPLQCCAHFLIRAPESLLESNRPRCGQSLLFYAPYNRWMEFCILRKSAHLHRGTLKQSQTGLEFDVP